jgi:hypothetical protein
MKYNRQWIFVTVLTMLGFAMLACAGGLGAQPPTSAALPTAPGGEAATPTTASGVLPAPTTDPAAQPTSSEAFTPPSAPAPNSEMSGISFYEDFDLFSSWSGEIVPAGQDMQGATDSPPEMSLPSYYRFDLDGYQVAAGLIVSKPRIIVIPVANIVEHSYLLEDITYLEHILADHPTEFVNNGLIGDYPLPTIPVGMVPMWFHTQTQYLDFQNGRGIRFLTSYTHMPTPLTNEMVLYNYQGITLDGKYYVAAYFAITHPSLPGRYQSSEEWPEAFKANSEAYTDEMVAMLAQADPASFIPGLARLDQLIQSLLVEPVQ